MIQCRLRERSGCKMFLNKFPEIAKYIRFVSEMLFEPYSLGALFVGFFDSGF